MDQYKTLPISVMKVQCIIHDRQKCMHAVCLLCNTNCTAIVCTNCHLR